MSQSNIRLLLKEKTLQDVCAYFQKRLQDIRKRQRMAIFALRKKEESWSIERIRKEIKNSKK